VTLYVWSLTLALWHGALHGYVADEGGDVHHACAHHPAPASQDLPPDTDCWTPGDCEVCEALRQALDGEWQGVEQCTSRVAFDAPGLSFRAVWRASGRVENVADRGPPRQVALHA
jgi:hypothetical protein